MGGSSGKFDEKLKIVVKIRRMEEMPSLLMTARSLTLPDSIDLLITISFLLTTSFLGADYILTQAIFFLILTRGYVY